MPTHVAIWIDHKEARIFHIQPDKSDETTVTAPLRSSHHKHPKGSSDKEHPDDAKRFFSEVERSLDGSEKILIVGPSTAKLELLRHLQVHAHALASKVAGIETVDHPTDAQLVAYAKKYFPLGARVG